MILASSGARARAPFFGSAMLTVAASVALVACGGGGGGIGDNDFTAPTASTNSGSTPSSPSTPAAPPVRNLAPGAELPPTLDAAQAGSTVLTGDDKQGIYRNAGGYTFVSSQGRLIYKDSRQWIFGSIEVTDSNWKFRVPTASRDSVLNSFDLVTGSGRIEPRKSMSGLYTKDGETIPAPLSFLEYDAANALAVTQEAMTGKWSTTAVDGLEMSIDVDASGTLTGRTTGFSLGRCDLRGTVLQTEAGTSRNLFNVDFMVTNAASGSEKPCFVPDGRTFTGLGGVVMVPASVFAEEGAYRTFYFHSATETFAVLTNGLRKQ